MATENTWKSILQPVATALVAFLAAATFYMQRAGEEASSAEMASLRARIDAVERQGGKTASDIDNLRALMSDVRSDVSFIRGKLEGKK